jgi:hypothetical protein
MPKYVVYQQPWGEIPGKLINEEVWVLAEDVIAWQKHRGYYESDEDALDTFMMVYWAKIVERDE